MFDFLEKLSHQHPNKSPPKQQTSNEVPYEHKQTISSKPPKSPKQTKNVSERKQKPKSLSLSAQLQLGQTATLEPQTLHLLEMIKDESEKWLNGLVMGMVIEEKSRVERKVYLREMSDSFDEYLEEVLIQSSSSNKYIRHGIAEIVDSVAGSIYEDILETDKYEISKKIALNKEEVFLLQRSLNHIKSKEGNIRDKVGELKLQLQDQSSRIQERSDDIVNKKSFSIHDPKTKEVEAFLKGLQFQRQQQHLQYEQFLEREREKKRRKEYMMEIAREKAQSERHNRLVEAYEIKRKVKEEEFQMMEKRNEEFKEYVKIQKKKKPLFIEKEQKYVQNFVHKEQQNIFNEILKRKQVYGPMSFEQIEDHEERYLEYKHDVNIRKRAEKKMNIEAEKRRKKDLQSLHKGEFRLHVLEEMVKKKQELAKDPKEELKKKKLKQMIYSQNVKEHVRPTVDPLKRMEMETMLSSKKKKRYRNPIRVRSSIGEDSIKQIYSNYGDEEETPLDPKKDGERNRRYLQQYIREKIEKGEIKRPENTARSMTIDHKPKPSYLEELRTQRESASRIKKAETIDNEISSIKQKGNVGALIAKVSQCDEKSRRLEDKFRMAPHKPEEEAELQDNYLFSIKAKMELLNNYD